MREIEDAREALDRVQRTVERWRWLIQNPAAAHELLGLALKYKEQPDKAALLFIELLDNRINPGA